MEEAKRRHRSCANCKHSMGNWDLHTICRNCRHCSSDNTCTICAEWPSSYWRKIARSATEATKRSRESDARSSSSHNKRKRSHTTSEIPQKMAAPQPAASGTVRPTDPLAPTSETTAPDPTVHAETVVVVADVHHAHDSPPVELAAPVAVHEPHQATSTDTLPAATPSTDVRAHSPTPSHPRGTDTTAPTAPTGDGLLPHIRHSRGSPMNSRNSPLVTGNLPISNASVRVPCRGSSLS